jgi:hypothetical protein
MSSNGQDGIVTFDMQMKIFRQLANFCITSITKAKEEIGRLEQKPSGIRFKAVACGDDLIRLKISNCIMTIFETINQLLSIGTRLCWNLEFDGSEHSPHEFILYSSTLSSPPLDNLLDICDMYEFGLEDEDEDITYITKKFQNQKI